MNVNSEVLRNGLSSEEYSRMWQSQGGKCLLCWNRSVNLFAFPYNVSYTYKGLICYNCINRK